MLNNISEKKRILMLLTAGLLLTALFVIAAGNPPYFTPAPPAVINCYQNSTCFYDFNATDDEADPYNFSIDTPPFSEYIGADTGIVNFTPANDEVGTYSNTWVIVKEIDTGNGNFALVTWNIININDPPNITAYYPQNLSNTTVKENALLGLNITVNDPDLIHGDTLSYTWTLDGEINLTLLNYTNDKANYTPDFYSAGIHVILVNVSDNQSVFRWINWTITVTNENRLPVNNNTIPNFTLMEDTPSYNQINLSDYFYDNDTQDHPLSYDVVFSGDEDITVLINATEPNNVSFIPDTDFSGINTLRFRCFDGYNYTLSNLVTINVTNNPDPPEVQQVANQTVYVDTWLNLQINAYDPDGDPLTYYDNASIFNINPATGFIQYYGVQGDIGNYSIEINVSDGMFNTSMVFNLSVINNTAPVLGGKPFADIITTEGNYTYLEFNAADVDPGDVLSFSSNSTPSSSIFDMTTTESSGLDAEGYMAFTPVQADVGIWIVTVTVQDNKFSEDYDTFTITILNTDFDPVLVPYPIPNQRMKVNKTFTYNISATDADENLDLFGDNTSLFNITTSVLGPAYSKIGRINFTPNDSQLGEHWVNITINDTTSRYNWSLVLFNVTLNTLPTIEAIPNQTGTEDQLFTYQVNASDIDPQDTLIYYDNTTIFNISYTTGLISFTPNANQTGIHVINITVSDGEANVSTIMNLTIGEFNDFPFWIPPLDEYYVNSSIYLRYTIWNSSVLLNYTTNMTLWNSSLYQNNLTLIFMDAYDEETATLSFSSVYINFTNASGDTITSGITLINLTSYDGDTALANLTPNNSQVGIYYVNFTIDDTTGRTNTTTIRLEVFNVNDPPTIVDYYPNITYYLNMSENSSMLFNVTAIDIDYGSSLHYQWAVNGTNISGTNSSSFTYNTDFSSAGWRNVTVFVLDEFNESAMVNWTINVSNVNRMGWFGQIRQYNSTHFNDSITKTNITVLPDEQGVIIYWNGTAYRPSALLESSVLDSRETNYFHEFTKINWTGNTTAPSGAAFSFTFMTRTADGKTPLSCPLTINAPYNSTDVYTVSNSQIRSDDKRCIQYLMIMETNNTAYTPSINRVIMGYEIADKTQEQNTNQSWIDLDSYFYDLDTDDETTYNVTAPDGLPITDINISIDSITNKVYTSTNDVFEGVVSILFSMFDGYNTTYSNIVNLTIEKIEEQTPDVIIVPVGGGGGGSVSNPVPYEVKKYVATPVSFRLLAPQKVTTYVNQTMTVPINLFNSNFTMENVKIKVSSENPDVKLTLSQEFIQRMEPNERKFIMLTIESYKTFGNYEVLIEAEADAISVAEDDTQTKSKFKENLKIFVNSLLKAQKNESQTDAKLAFAQDLLTTNPECLELNEFIKKVQKSIQDEDTKSADKMLDQVIESCKYLIAPKEEQSEIEAPVKVYGMPVESLFILGTVALITLIVAIALVIGWAHIKAKKKELTKKIGGPPPI